MEAEVAAPNPLLEKVQQLSQAVQKKPDDFGSWTKLLSAVEKLDDLQQIRTAFDAFLAEYPLCFGYWKRWAEAERRHGSVEAAVAVYQRGTAATPTSCDLWSAYIGLLQATDAATDTVRGVFEAAVGRVGPDWLSGGLWEQYLAFEGSHGSPAAVAALYSRLLGCPIKELDEFHQGLVTYAASRTADELLPADTLAALRSGLEQEAAAKQAAAAEAAEAAASAQEAAAAAGASAGAAAGAVEGAAAAGAQQADATAVQDTEMADAGEPLAAAAGAAPPDPPSSSNIDPQQAAAAAAAEAAAKAAAEAAAATAAAASDDGLKATWLQQQEARYQATRQQQQQRQPFEEAIRRPYWHVKPLDGAQLKNWAAYLDWQQAQGDAAATVRLFERCLVPCASYPEFWQRFVCWCEAHQPDAAAAVLARAAGGFCKRSPDFGVFAARFLEAAGQLDEARAMYRHLLTAVTPGLLQVVQAAANFERRVADTAAACAVFEQLQQQEAAKGDSSLLGFVCVWYANFLRQVCGDVDRAREVLQQGLTGPAAASKVFWEGAVHFEETLPGGDRVRRVMALFDRLLADRQAVADASGSSANGSAAAGPAAAAAGTADGAGSAEEAADASGSSSRKGVLPDEAAEELSKRCVEFADMHADIATLRRVQLRHAQLFMLPAATLSAGSGVAAGAAAADKRAASDGAAAAAAANGLVAKAARSDAAVTAPAAAATAAAALGQHEATGYYPSGAAAAAAAAASGYAAHWQQQQGYAHGYAQHYGHSAYGGYGGYDRGYEQQGYERYGGY